MCVRAPPHTSPLQCTGVACRVWSGREACAILLAGRDGVMGTASCDGNYSTTEEDGAVFLKGACS